MLVNAVRIRFNSNGNCWKVVDDVWAGGESIVTLDFFSKCSSFVDWNNCEWRKRNREVGDDEDDTNGMGDAGGEDFLAIKYSMENGLLFPSMKMMMMMMIVVKMKMNMIIGNEMNNSCFICVTN